MEVIKMDNITSVTDLHIHIVPCYDDGAEDYGEAIKMLDAEYNSGVRRIFCTSHSGHSFREAERYRLQFETIKMVANVSYPDITLYKGNEILCSDEYVDDVLYGLEKGVFNTLGDSKCVLVELFYNAKPPEARSVAEAFLKNGYTPILAHVERYDPLFDEGESAIRELVDMGCLIQVNAGSFVCEWQADYEDRARMLLSSELIHFVGTDAHNTTYRSPNMDIAIDYIRENASPEYAYDILTGNTDKYILNS
jgi:protein-tyrosine phosphatase